MDPAAAIDGLARYGTGEVQLGGEAAGERLNGDCMATTWSDGYGGRWDTWADCYRGLWDTWADGSEDGACGDRYGGPADRCCDEKNEGTAITTAMAMVGEEPLSLLGGGRRRCAGCWGDGYDEGEGAGSSESLRGEKSVNDGVGGRVSMANGVGEERRGSNSAWRDACGCGRARRLTRRLYPFSGSFMAAVVLCVFLCCCASNAFSDKGYRKNCEGEGNQPLRREAKHEEHASLTRSCLMVGVNGGLATERVLLTRLMWPNVLRISCGWPSNEKFGDGSWVSDKDFVVSSLPSYPANVASGRDVYNFFNNETIGEYQFPLAFPWRTCRRFNESGLAYTIPVPQGQFVLMRLHFAFINSTLNENHFNVNVNGLVNVTTVGRRLPSAEGYSFYKNDTSNGVIVITKEFLFYPWQPNINLSFSDYNGPWAQINAMEVIPVDESYSRFFSYCQLEKDMFLRLEGRLNCGGHVEGVRNNTDGNPFWWDSDSSLFNRSNYRTRIVSDSSYAFVRDELPWVPGNVWSTQRVFDNVSVLYGIETEPAAQYLMILYFLQLNSTKPVASTIDIQIDGLPVNASYKVFESLALKLFRPGFDRPSRRSVRLILNPNDPNDIVITAVELYGQIQALGPSPETQATPQDIPYVTGSQRPSSDPCMSPVPDGYTCNYEYGQRPTVVSCNITGRDAEGKIDPNILSFVNLETLVLSKNRLTGEIPSDIAKLSKLVTLDLSHNNLTGEIPESLGNIVSLQNLNLQYNNLSGEIPTPLSTPGNRTFMLEEGNSHLCRQGLCHSPNGSNGSLPSDQSNDSSKSADSGSPALSSVPSPKSPSTLSRTLILALALVILVIAGTVVAIVMVAHRMPKRNKPVESPSPSVRLVDRKGQKRHHNAISGMQPYCQVFTYLELKTATNNFSEELGRGNFGRVYKGVLSNNQAVAVKIRKDEACSRQSEFVKEIKTLSALNHKNLVRLIGYCSEGKVQALVYEHVGNGNLEQHLREGKLDWQTRLKISLGAAYAVEYLHTQAYPAVIHRDIKPANIMLDENFEAKVTDFGLSRVIIKEETTTMSDTDVRGSTGSSSVDVTYDRFNN
ncbi:hypothetical protein CBR_g32040 [Chara braunii]|uniref:non-specific serine/threonine protein kinase n=1 Tax=Chara braunii TaxID=69332 RepID=A0A388LGH3_CHABU|nr:hypothetical protein CBR_g32040 [Chara braunii]|eukprot:GBG81367.1 hypothetical protein CBR_g32040 [Chara braunii]